MHLLGIASKSTIIGLMVYVASLPFIKQCYYQAVLLCSWSQIVWWALQGVGLSTTELVALASDWSWPQTSNVTILEIDPEKCSKLSWISPFFMKMVSSLWCMTKAIWRTTGLTPVFCQVLRHWAQEKMGMEWKFWCREIGQPIWKNVSKSDAPFPFWHRTARQIKGLELWPGLLLCATEHPDGANGFLFSGSIRGLGSDKWLTPPVPGTTHVEQAASFDMSARCLPWCAVKSNCTWNV